MKKYKRLTGILLIFSLVLTMVMSTAAVSDAASYSGSYWLKVNEQRNVVTAYKRISGEWKPVRVMLCSTGVGGATPKGTFYTRGKWNWGHLMNDVYGQYCTHITEDILFHSVYYTKLYDKKSQPTAQFNYLGSAASHGCIRLSVMDAKWIYDNCAVGTKVTIYRSQNPGPLGKPAGIKVSQGRYQYWDPTDPDSANPYYKLKKPVITVSSKKKLDVQYKSNYNLLSYVNAKDPNTKMNLKALITVSSVKKYSAAKKAYVKAAFSANKRGTYKVTYKVKDPYSGTAYKTIKIKVTDSLKAPTISGAKSRSVTWGSRNAVTGVTAKQLSCDRTKAIKVYIKKPDAEKYKIYSYDSAVNYKFSEAGKYTVKYIVKNKYNPNKTASKMITITSKKTDVNKDPVLTVPTDKNVLIGTTGSASGAFNGVSAVHNGKDYTSRIKISILAPGSSEFVSITSSEAKSYVFDKTGEYKVQYSVKNGYTPYQTVTKTVKVTVTDPEAEIDTEEL